ncbi:carbonic anhydrase [Micractinium conductrix]|uniref:Carbonic anhydrase n=1 Tax=Micractinium conductrix TaxID=554055 RepID=A0A2P6VHA4_9CHLO|nr:carbonic anhydrase [Micractinium conductrix]|eukprot:PSC73476.1 carbonic anhydrase [Micractinium conductrix]
MCNGECCTPQCAPAADLAGILNSNRQWAEAQVRRDPRFFTSLVATQMPQWLWIGCSDSRVPANELLGLGPGEVFVQRNVGNLATLKDMNCMATLEYAVNVLKVKHVIVCGHYGCGAVKGALTMPCATPGLVNLWIQDIRDTRDRNIEVLRRLQGAEQVDKLVELNVLRQVFNVCTSPIVQQAWNAGQPVAVHGLVYALYDGILKPLTPPITSLEDFEAFSHMQELDGLRHLSLSVLQHMSFERECLRRASIDRAVSGECKQASATPAVQLAAPTANGVAAARAFEG